MYNNRITGTVKGMKNKVKNDQCLKQDIKQLFLNSKDLSFIKTFEHKAQNMKF